jgi:hypothetical protein
MSYKWGNTSIKRATKGEGIKELLFECATKSLSESKYDMTIPWRGGFRTSEEQNEIFSRGSSNKDGYDKKSYHQSGWAIDIVPYGIEFDLDRIISRKDLVPKEFRHFAALMFKNWQIFISEGRTTGILGWGGNWENFVDVPHWQVKFYN